MVPVTWIRFTQFLYVLSLEWHLFPTFLWWLVSSLAEAKKEDLIPLPLFGRHAVKDLEKKGKWICTTVNKMSTWPWCILEDWIDAFPVVGGTLKGLLGDVAVGLRTTQINRYKPEGKTNTTTFSLYLAVGTVNKTREVRLLMDGRLWCGLQIVTELPDTQVSWGTITTLISVASKKLGKINSTLPLVSKIPLCSHSVYQNSALGTGLNK